MRPYDFQKDLFKVTNKMKKILIHTTFIVYITLSLFATEKPSTKELRDLITALSSLDSVEFDLNSAVNLENSEYAEIHQDKGTIMNMLSHQIISGENYAITTSSDRKGIYSASHTIKFDGSMLTAIEEGPDSSYRYGAVGRNASIEKPSISAVSNIFSAYQFLLLPLSTDQDQIDLSPTPDLFKKLLTDEGLTMPNLIRIENGYRVTHLTKSGRATTYDILGDTSPFKPTKVIRKTDEDTFIYEYDDWKEFKTIGGDLIELPTTFICKMIKDGPPSQNLIRTGKIQNLVAGRHYKKSDFSCDLTNLDYITDLDSGKRTQVK